MNKPVFWSILSLPLLDFIELWPAKVTVPLRANESGEGLWGNTQKPVACCNSSAAVGCVATAAVFLYLSLAVGGQEKSARGSKECQNL